MEKDQLHQKFQVAQIIWGSAFGAILIYGFVAYQRVQEMTGSLHADDKIFYLLFIISLVTVISIGQVKTIFVVSKPSDPSQPYPFGPDELADRVFKMSMVCFGLCEVPALFGLVAAISLGQMKYFYILALLSVIALAIHSPKLEEWKGWKTGQ